jgi:hypothetical protein
VALAALCFTHTYGDELDWWLPFTAAQLALSLFIAFGFIKLLLFVEKRSRALSDHIGILLLLVSWFMMPLTMIISTFVRAGSVSGTPNASVTWFVFTLNAVNLVQLPQLFFWFAGT